MPDLDHSHASQDVTDTIAPQMAPPVRIGSVAWRWVDIGAAIVGVVGTPFIVREILVATAAGSDGRVWKHDPWVWASLFAAAIFLGALIAFILTIAHRLSRNERNLRTVVQVLRSRLVRRHSEPRELQREAFEALSGIYGYHIDLFRYHFTIYDSSHVDEAEGESHHEVAFVAGRRNLSRWSRTADSSLIPQGGAKDKPQMDGTNVRVKTEKKGNQIVEIFEFLPTVQSRLGPKCLRFKGEQPKGTFLRRTPNSKNRTTDWISFAPREPIKLLELSVTFNGFHPPDFRASARYNPAGFELEQEAVEAQFLLRLDHKDGWMSATLQIPFPVIGVVYRIEWDLPTDPPDSPHATQLSGHPGTT